MTIKDVLERGVTNVTPKKLAQEKLAGTKKLRVYLGVDPTGAKLHLGHAVPLRKLQQFVELGHEVFFLIGSFTAMIGDPTGKDVMREPLTPEIVKNNFANYKAQASKVLDFSKVSVVYNHTWLESLTFGDILKLSSAFTVQQMLERDMFQRRLQEGKPINMQEFFYPLMQGYDSVQLDVDCEIGGNDQYFNLLAGRTLQQAYGKREKFVVTTQLIPGTDGRKMSKTYNNCIYLDDEPNDMYGKILSISDSLIVQYFECCTNVSLEELEAIIKELRSTNNPKSLKMKLARMIVTDLHSTEAAMAAEAHFENVFANKGVPDDIPEVEALEDELLLDALAKQPGIPSKSELRRIIEQGGLKLNDAPITNIKVTIKPGVYKVGKRRFYKITIKKKA